MSLTEPVVVPEILRVERPEAVRRRRILVWGGVLFALAGSLLILLVSFRREAEEKQLLVEQAAMGEVLDPDLVAAVVHAESKGNPRAVSPAQAYGLMQLRVSTASEMAGRAVKVDELFDPAFNLRLGCKYLHELLDRYDGDTILALMAYNAGPTRVARWRAAEPDPRRILAEHAFAETRTYVRRVLAKYRELKAAD